MYLSGVDDYSKIEILQIKESGTSVNGSASQNENPPSGYPMFLPWITPSWDMQLDKDLISYREMKSIYHHCWAIPLDIDWCSNDPKFSNNQTPVSRKWKNLPLPGSWCSWPKQGNFHGQISWLRFLPGFCDCPNIGWQSVTLLARGFIYIKWK